MIFLFTRIIAFAGAYQGATQLIAAEPSRNKGWLAELALNWDAAWYTGIALHGYRYDPAASGGTNVAFAPMYPFLLDLLSGVLGFVAPWTHFGEATYGRLIVSGLLISNAAFLIALYLLQNLLAPRLGRTAAAALALAVASLPTSFFYSVLYTEGLFLLLSVAAFSVARSDWRQKWLCAGLLGLLASLTKFAGLLLLPVLLIEFWTQRANRRAPHVRHALWLGLVPAGFLLYVGFLWWEFGDPGLIAKSQLKGWNHQLSFFATTYWNSVSNLWSSYSGVIPPAQDRVLLYGEGSRLYLILDLALPALLMVGAVLARRKLRPAEWTWVALGIIYPLSSNITFSMARYILPLWPGLVWFGLVRGRLRLLAALLLAVSLGLLFICSSRYGGARWIG